jgi:hypothetical protein
MEVESMKLRYEKLVVSTLQTPQNPIVLARFFLSCETLGIF